MALNVISEGLIKILNKPLDPALIRKNYGGEKYITGYTVVRLLNEFTNCAWDFTIDRKWVEKCTDKKGDHEIYHMDITLNCYFNDGGGNTLKLSKPGTAGKVLESGAKNASNIYKSLETLALRKAASYFGVGAELWLNEEELDYFDAQDADTIWTDELMEQHSAEFERIAAIQKEYELTDDDIDAVIAEWDNQINELAEILPEKLTSFVEFLESQTQEEEK